ncbi:MAG: hypothetical protein ACKV0T_27615, partial [Planctomycetales bacterium]
MLQLETLDVKGLEVVTALPDLRRDLHCFVDSVRDRNVKRSHRGNALSKSDAKRIAKLMSIPDAALQVDKEGYSDWVNYVDEIALKLGFVQYDTEGSYAGYTSQEPTFPENYIKFQAKPYQQFLGAKAAKQETTLLESLLRVDQGSASEFYRQGALGRLDGFSQRGSGIGVMPLLDFAAIRRFLLELLAECPSGQWQSTASLVEHLKQRHRYFLIPAKPQFKHKYEENYGRYGNFRESKERWGSETNIPESDPDGFERVEGRYVERFLEGLPLVLRYVDAAYAKQSAQPIFPSLGRLVAFRVSDRLRHALAGQLAEPRVTVTPNFEVHVVADMYPAGALARLAPLCDMVSPGPSFLLKLTKQKVAAARAASPNLNAADLLRSLSGGELPANVAHELAAWSEHGEKFTLYSNCSILESDPTMPAADSLTIERIAPGVRLVRAGDKLFDELERQGLVPIRTKAERKNNLYNLLLVIVAEYAKTGACKMRKPRHGSAASFVWSL